MQKNHLSMHSWFREDLTTHCNSLYASLLRARLDRIQSVFNGAVRLIFGASQFSHVTPLLRDHLHRLRCPERKVTKSALPSVEHFMEWRLATLLISVYRLSSAKGDLCYDLRRQLALDLRCQDDHLAPVLVTRLFVCQDQLLGTVSLKASD